MNNILFVTTSYPRFEGDYNGVFIQDLGSRLSNENNIFVISPWKKGLKKHEVINNISIYRHKQFFWDVDFAYGDDIMNKIRKNKLLLFVAPVFMFFQFIMIKKITKKHSIDIIHAFWLIPSALMAAIYKNNFNKKIKIVATLLGEDVHGFINGWKNKLLKFTIKYCNYITAQSQELIEIINNNGFYNDTSFTPVSIDSDLYSLKINNLTKRKKLLFVGTLNERKNILGLIDALNVVNQNNLDFELNVIGDGPLKVECLNLVTKYNLKNKVFFLGSKPPNELPIYFKASDIFILPSFQEGFPVVLLSALSCGKPSIVSNIPVFKELNLKHAELLILSATDYKSIAKSILNTMENLNILNQKANIRRDFVIENYNMESIVKKYNKIYNNLITQ
jgi:glycosyltransferase involved in cell wall biosynthesis